MVKTTKAVSFVLCITLLLMTFLTMNTISARAATIPPALNFNLTVSGLTNPDFMTNAGDGSNRLFIVQQPGQIQVFKNGSLLATPFLNISGLVSNFTGQNGEQGLLCLAFDPNYQNNGIFYITYTTTNNDPTYPYTTTLARYHVSNGNPDVADPSSGVVLLSIPKKYTNHNGGMIAFGLNGYLYMSMGDGGSGGDPDNNAQNLHTMLGKLLRLDVHSTPPVGQKYVIPATNPYYGSSDPNVKKEIWSYGLRNPWRFSFDRSTGDLYIGDVGQDVEEEVDFQSNSSPGGQNYGWRILEGNLCYNPATNCNAPSNYVPPVAVYDHGTGHSYGCSITGGYIYRGNQYPSLHGVYFYGDFCSGKVLGLIKNANNTWSYNLIVSTSFSISSFGEDEQGEVYLVDRGAGKIYQIGLPSSTITGNVGLAGVTLSYVDGTVKTVTSDGSGNYSISVPYGWSGIVTPYKSGYTFTPVNRSYSNVQVDQTAQDYTAQICGNCAEINVKIGAGSQGDYSLPSGQSMVQAYSGVAGGPVVVASNNGANIIASMLELRRSDITVNQWTGIAQVMGVPVGQLSDQYMFPRYTDQDPTKYEVISIANFETFDTNVTVKIGATSYGPFAVAHGAFYIFRRSVTGGPVLVSSDNGARIIASLYQLKRAGSSGRWNGQSEMMGIPPSRLSDTSVLAYYDSTTPGLLPFINIANADTITTDITVSIGTGFSVTYPAVAAGTSQVVSYSGVAGGPVVVKSSNGAKVIASMLELRRSNITVNQWTGIAQVMGVPVGQLSDKYVFPRYTNIDATKYEVIPIANYETFDTHVTVKVGSTSYGPYLVPAGTSYIFRQAIEGGPVIVSSDNAARIIASLYQLKRVGTTGRWNGQSEMIGIPLTQLSTTYVLPYYDYTTPGLQPFLNIAAQ